MKRTRFRVVYQGIYWTIADLARELRMPYHKLYGVVRNNPFYFERPPARMPAIEIRSKGLM